MTNTITKPYAAHTGIVHLGLGAFFRAHGAQYTQHAMQANGGDWAVVGVSLRSPTVRDVLAAKHYSYTAVEVSSKGYVPTTINIINNVLVAAENSQAVLDVMAAEHTKIVSLTVTEKGYCLSDNGLDLSHADIQHDIANELPRTAIGYIVRALELRKKSVLPPFTVLSMDNLPANGQLTKQAVITFAKQIDTGLAQWIDTHCRFPSSMVDRIVPATTQAHIDKLATACNIQDAGAVFHEPFKQWVIEDNFVNNQRPAYEAYGAQLVAEVEPFEHMKLRMLNGTHSALAYIGRLLDLDTVESAIKHPTLGAFIDALWSDEIASSLQAPLNTNLTLYAQELKSRYQNSAIQHHLQQIAMDGSQKLPQRILAPLFENLNKGKPYNKLLFVLAAWISFVQKQRDSLNDPLATTLTGIVKPTTNTANHVDSILDIKSVFGAYPVQLIRDELVSQLDIINTHGIASALTTI